MSDETTPPNPAENSDSERAGSPRGRPFAKGQSGNPGGRPKGLEKVRAQLLELAPLAVVNLQCMLECPPPEVVERANPKWLAALARQSLGATKLWFEYTVPKPTAGEAYELPALAPPPAGSVTTLAMLSDVRHILATEVQRLKAVSDAGVPLTESAAGRLTECVRQLAVLTENEVELSKANPFAKLTDDELRAKLAS